MRYLTLLALLFSSLTHAQGFSALPTQTPGGVPYCTGANPDPDRDGFGFENGVTCRMRGGPSDNGNTAAGTWPKIKPTTGNTVYCPVGATDPEGDGFGWHASTGSCIVQYGPQDPDRVTSPGCPINGTGYVQCSQPRLGWGWENNRACVGEKFCPGKRDPLGPLDTTLANPNSNARTVAVWNYLRSIYGTKTLAGQMDHAERDSNDMFQKVFDDTGKWPALAGYDLLNYTKPQHWTNGLQQVEEAIAYWNAGGLVTLTWHWEDPSEVTKVFYSSGSKLVIPMNGRGQLDTASNTWRRMVEDMDIIARQLKRLQDAGVVVLWRPLHEANGTWFWWGRNRNDNVPVPYAWQQLYRYMFNRYTHHHKLNNLIWVYNGRSPGFGSAAWYPGEDYVDIVAWDNYQIADNFSTDLGNPFKEHFDYTEREAVGSRKMVWMTEAEAMPNPDRMKSEGAVWGAFKIWVDWHPWEVENRSNFYSAPRYGTKASRTAVYNHADVITRDELPSSTWLSLN